VDQAGWYTFASEWTSDGTSLTNTNTISQGGTVLFEGSTVGALTPDSEGYESGYMWLYTRDDYTTTLGVDNLTYIAIPEPATVSLLGMGAWMLIRKRRAG
jgi:hypothetical protein